MPKSTWAKIALVCILAIGGFLFGEIFRAKAVSPGDVIINEIMWMGSSASSSDEWIELKNTTSHDIDLSNWDITKKSSGTEKLMLTIPAGSIIQANSYFLISNYAETSASSILNITPDLVDTAISLVNSQLQIKLYDGPWESTGNLIDTADDGSGSPLAGAYTSGSRWESMERNSDPGDGTLTASWHTATSSLNFDSGTTEKGTPGAVNSTPNQAPEIESTTANPSSVIADGSTSLLLTVAVSDPDGLGDIDSVTIDLSGIGGETAQAMYDDASHGDATASDGTYSYSTTVLLGTEPGGYSLTITVLDLADNETTGSLVLTVTAPVYPEDVIVNEFLANPAGSDSEGEWIELYNKGSTSVDLSSWQLDDIDGGSSPYTIPGGTSIKAGQYLVFYRTDTSFALNNNGDTVRLLHPNGNVVSFVSYTESAGEDIAYARDSNNSWSWTTTLTPGQENSITVLEDDEEEEEETQDEETEEGQSKDSPKELSVLEAREEEKGTWVKIKGIVVCPPGIFSGSTVFYIQDEKSGIKIYFSKEGFNNIKLGDEIEIIGKVSERSGEKKINLTSTDDVVILSSKETPKALSVKTGEIGEDLEGMLVTISGKIISTHGSVFYIDDGSGKIKVYIKKSTGINKPKMHKGDEVTITGIVSEAYQKYRVLPRYQEDVKLASGNPNSKENPEKLANTGTDLWITILISCLLMNFFWLCRKKIQLT